MNEQTIDKTHCGNWIQMCSGCADLKCEVGKAQCDGCQLIDAERKIEQLESKLYVCMEQLPVAWEVVPNALHEGGLFRSESAANYVAATSLHTTVRPLYTKEPQ